MKFAGYALNAIDVHSHYIFDQAIKSRNNLSIQMEIIRLQIAAKGRTLKVIRSDNEFITKNITSWTNQHQIQLCPCIP